MNRQDEGLIAHYGGYAARRLRGRRAHDEAEEDPPRGAAGTFAFLPCFPALAGSSRLGANVRLPSQASVPVEAQVQHLGQKYMGSPNARVRDHRDAVFNTNVVRPEGGHPVPVSNFMNAQYMSKTRHPATL